LSTPRPTIVCVLIMSAALAFTMACGRRLPRPVPSERVSSTANAVEPARAADEPRDPASAAASLAPARAPDATTIEGRVLDFLGRPLSRITVTAIENGSCR
jgi:hypothetical protein